jgi:hypothetical protein
MVQYGATPVIVEYCIEDPIREYLALKSTGTGKPTFHYKESLPKSAGTKSTSPIAIIILFLLN